MITLIRTVILDHTIIEIHYNQVLKHKPYMMRIFTYDENPIEIRYDKEDIDNFYKVLNDNTNK